MPASPNGKTARVTLTRSSMRYAGAQTQQARSHFYEDDVAATNPLRTQQASELEAYIQTLKADRTRSCSSLC